MKADYEKMLKAQNELLKSGHGQKVTSLSGDTFVVDISDEACLKFGFRHGDEAIDPTGDEVTIVGVAPHKLGHVGHNVLWYKEKGDKGVGYWGDDPRKANLLKEGFRLK